MENRKNTPDTDIADERYAGPNKAVVAAGNGVFEHLKWAGGLLAVSVAIAAIFPKNIATFLENSRNFATRMKGHEKASLGDMVKRSTGKLIHSLFGEGKNAVGAISGVDPEHQLWLEHTVMNREHGFGHWFTTHVVGLLPKLGKSYKNLLLEASKQPAGSESARWTNALTFGGAFGALGYAGGWIGAILKGSRHGGDGKDQLQRAQQEIRDTRELNELLQAQYLEMRREAQDLKTKLAAQQGTLKVAKDETPPTGPEQPATPALLDAATDQNSPVAETLPTEMHTRHVKHTPYVAPAREPIRPPEERDWAESVKAERHDSHEPARA